MNDLIQIQNKDGAEMMVNINGNFKIRTCYFKVAFSVGDACGNHKLCGCYLFFSKNIRGKQREFNKSHMESDNVRFPC